MRRWTPEEKAEIARRFAAGETVPALCVAYGTSWQMIRKFLKRAGVGRLRADGRAYQRNLADEEKAAIVLRYQAGESAPDLAVAFACSHQTVGRAIRAAGLALRTNSEAHVECSLRADAFDIGPDGPTAEQSYWLGFLFADGCLHHHRGHGAPALKVGLAAKDAGHLEKLRGFLGSTHAIRHVGVAAEAGGKRHGVADLYIRSAALVASLERLGMGLKSRERVALPAFVDSRDFWRGVVDGDGTVSVQPPYLQLCGGERLVGQFADYMERNGVVRAPVTKHSPAVPCWYFRVGPRRNMLRGVRLLYEGAAVALDRKAERAVRLCR